LGGLQTIENQEESSDIEKRDGSGGSKSQTPIERGEAVMERPVKNLRMARRKGHNWTWTR
jgi:hypothetical protein